MGVEALLGIMARTVWTEVSQKSKYKNIFREVSVSIINHAKLSLAPQERKVLSKKQTDILLKKKGGPPPKLPPEALNSVPQDLMEFGGQGEVSSEFRLSGGNAGLVIASVTAWNLALPLQQQLATRLVNLHDPKIIIYHPDCHLWIIRISGAASA